MNVFVFGYFGAGNLGDEAILDAFAAWLRARFPDVSIRALSSNPEQTESAHGVAATPRNSLPALVRSILWADVVVAPGGGVFQDATSARSVLYYAGICALARFYHRPVYLLSQGVGPLSKGSSRRAVRRVFSNATYVSVRDPESRATLEKVGVNSSKIVSAGDAVLGLADIVGSPVKADAEGTFAIGIALRQHETLEPILNTLPKALESVAEKAGKAIRLRLLPFQMPEDAAVAHRFAERCKNLRNVVTEIFEHDGTDAKQVAGAYDRLKLTVGMRLHSLVISALRGVPFVGLAYDPKVAAFAGACAMPVSLSPATMGAEELAAMILSLLRAPEEPVKRMRLRIEADVAKLRASLDEAAELIVRPGQHEAMSLSVPISTRNFEQTMSEIEAAAKERRKLHVVTVNPEIIVMGRRSDEFRRILTRRSGMNTADGIGVRQAVRAKYGIHIGKVTGIDIVRRLLETSTEKNLRLFLLGSRPEVLEECVKRLEAMEPRPIVAGWHHGYLRDVPPEDLAARINESKADVVFVGMGPPLQENWIDANRDRLDAPVFIGVGGTFDVLAGAVKRAPRFYQKKGLEWMYRLATQPERMRRILSSLPLYACLSLIEAAQRRVGLRKH